MISKIVKMPISTFVLLCASISASAATCTASANTQSALQNCINSAGNGDTVFLPAGTYTINSTINCVKNLTITGPQDHSAILHNPGGFFTFSTNDTTAQPQCSYTYLTFDNGGIVGLSLIGTIDHNIFKNRVSNLTSGRHGTLTYFWGVQGGSITNNVFLGLTNDPELSSDTQIGAITGGNCMDTSTITGNYIDGGFQGVGWEDRGCYGFNNHWDNNVIRHQVSSYFESGDSMRQSTFSNNYLDTPRKAYPGHKTPPDGLGHQCDPSERGGFYCDDFGFSIVGAGNSQICNNKIYGPGVWGIEYQVIDPVTGSNTCNNEIRDWGIFVLLANDGSDSPHSGNIACGNNPGNAADSGNTWYSSCSNPSMPAVSPVPCAPINPNTGANNDATYPAGCGGIPLPPPADYTITMTPATRTVTQGKSSSYNVSITGVNAYFGTAALSVTGFPGSAGYAYCRTLTIDHTQVGATDLTNKTVGLLGTFTWLRTIPNGGHVQLSDGKDITFATDCTGQTQLKPERVFWNGTTGQSEFWVKVPTVSHTTDTSIAVLYGNAAVVVDPSDPANTWDSSYTHVYHLKDGTTLSGVDAKGTASVTNNSATAAAGQVDGGVAVTGGTNMSGALGGFSGPLTIEAWVKPTSLSAAGSFASHALASASAFGFWLDNTTAAECSTNQGGPGVQSLNPAVTVGSWNHVVCVFDGTNAKIYVNGAQAYTSAFTAQVNNASGDTLAIGADPGGGESFDGVIDEVRISNAARSAGWILADYNNAKTGANLITVGSEQTIGSGSVTTYSFTPPALIGGGNGVVASSVLNFQLPADATPGNYNIVVTGTDSSNSLSHSTSVSGLTVLADAGSITNVSVGTISSTQAILRWNSATTPGSCVVEASKNPSYTPLLDDVNPAIFAGSNLASRKGNVIAGSKVEFVLGKRAAERGLDGKIHSRALQSGTTYYARITCSSAQATTKFTTAKISIGNTWLEQPAPDGLGNWLQPDITATDRTQEVVDPLTGELIKTVSLPTDNTNRSTNEHFTYGFGTGWTNPSNAIQVDGTFATITNNAAKLAITGPTGFWSVIHAPNYGLTPQDEYVLTMFAPTISMKSSNSSLCTLGNIDTKCAVQICVTLSGATCAGAITSIQLTSTLTAYPLGTASYGDALQVPGHRVWNQSETAYRNGNVTCNGTGTVTWAGGDLFPETWTSGSSFLINVNGTLTLFSLASYTNTRALSLTTNCATGTWPSSGMNFGLLVWRVDPNTDTVSIDGASINYNLGFHRAPPDYSGAYNQCSDTTVIGYNGDPGFNCTNDYAGGAQVFWIDSITGESHIFALLGGTFIASPFKPGSPDSWYIDIGSGNLQQVTYTGDHLEPTSAQTTQAGNPVFGVFSGDLFACDGTHTTRCYTKQTITSAGNTIGDLAGAFTANFNKTKFAALAFNQAESGILHWTAQTGAFSVGWNIAFDPNITTNGRPGNAGCLTNGNSGCVIAMMPSWTSPGCRWCTIKVGTPLYIADWLQFTPYFDQPLTPLLGVGQGPFVNKVVGTISDTSTTCPANNYGQTNNCVTITVDGEPYDLGEGTSSRGTYGNAAVGDQVDFPAIGTHYNSEGMLLIAKSGNQWTFARNYNIQTKLTSAQIGTNAFLRFTCANIWPEWQDNSLRGKEEQWHFRTDIFGLNAGGTTVVNSANGVNSHYYWGNGSVGYSYSQDTRCTATFGCYQGQKVQTTFDDLMSGVTPITGLATQGPSFQGITAPYNNGGWQSHPWGAGDLASAQDQHYFFDSRPFLGYTLTPTVTNVVNNTYKIAAANVTLNRKFLPTLTKAGPHSLLDVSGPGSTITADYQYCVVVVAGECNAGSAAGDVYVSVPHVTYPFCQYYGGNAQQVYEDIDICVGDASAMGNAIVRLPLDKFDYVGRENQYLGHGLVQPGYIDPFWHGHPLGNGNWIYGYSQQVSGYASGEYLWQTQPVLRDSVDRTQFIPVIVTGKAPTGATKAIAEFGYGEYDSDNLYCTSRNETCAVGAATNSTKIQTTPFWFETTEKASLAGTPCTSACQIAIPALPNHTLYYRFAYLNASGTVIARGKTMVYAVY